MGHGGIARKRAVDKEIEAAVRALEVEIVFVLRFEDLHLRFIDAAGDWFIDMRRVVREGIGDIGIHIPVEPVALPAVRDMNAGGKRRREHITGQFFKKPEVPVLELRHKRRSPLLEGKLFVGKGNIIAARLAGVHLRYKLQMISKLHFYLLTAR